MRALKETQENHHGGVEEESKKPSRGITKKSKIWMKDGSLDRGATQNGILYITSKNHVLYSIGNLLLRAKIVIIVHRGSLALLGGSVFWNGLGTSELGIISEVTLQFVKLWMNYNACAIHASRGLAIVRPFGTWSGPLGGILNFGFKTIKATTRKTIKIDHIRSFWNDIESRASVNYIQ
ncbi:hypothetical protein ACJX0J_030991, partial [Zea mays]